MEVMEQNKFYLPDGLPLEAGNPTWLWDIFPYTKLDSSIGSLISVLALSLLFAVICWGLSWVSKTFLPNFLKLISKFLFILASVGFLVGGGLSTIQWNSENSISDESIGVQVTRTADWLKTQGVGADNRAIWDLVCNHYDNKNLNCRAGQKVVVKYKQKDEKVRLERQSDGSIILWDYEKSMPLSMK